MNKEPGDRVGHFMTGTLLAVVCAAVARFILRRSGERPGSRSRDATQLLIEAQYTFRCRRAILPP